ncbi:HPF/RaiA family ribosome-associated protein [Rhizomonospora bruguierae]|uniref:HPF/RaiA family ribosome-associated protein n=1 Tax=Rhizomonospora bruguierae TaxID=1581705 RepID=UPI001BCF2333|nr:HPF/RaiA family ribosome-associated protein [Micromonospora sp. NBRC 107566]
MTQVFAIPVPQIRVHGGEAATWQEYAIEKVATVLRQAPGPVLHVRLLLDAFGRGGRAEAHVDVNGVTVHAHAMGGTVQEAIDLMQDRLRGQVRRMRRRPTDRLTR